MVKTEWRIDVIKPDTTWPDEFVCRLGLQSIPPGRLWRDYNKVEWEWMDELEGANEMLVIAHAATTPKSSAKQFLQKLKAARKK